VSAAVTPRRNSPVLYNQANHHVVDGLRFYQQVEKRAAQHLLSPFQRTVGTPSASTDISPAKGIQR
jgi:hypothetical protein